MKTKRQVNRTLQYAVKKGILIRGICNCGSESKTHGHHPNYELPLDVVWVCPKCHSRIHHPIDPRYFQMEDEKSREVETAWEQSVHVVENEMCIRGRLATAIC